MPIYLFGNKRFRLPESRAAAAPSERWPAHLYCLKGDLYVKDRLKTHEDRDFVCLEPRLKARVRMRNWTKAGLLRAPASIHPSMQYFVSNDLINSTDFITKLQVLP